MSIPKYFISMSERLYFVEVVQRVQSVKVVVIRSPAEARTPLCALLRMLGLARMAGIVFCSESPLHRPNIALRCGGEHGGQQTCLTFPAFLLKRSITFAAARQLMERRVFSPPQPPPSLSAVAPQSNHRDRTSYNCAAFAFGRPSFATKVPP